MPGLLHLPPEVLTLIAEEVCITAELDNLVQTVTVELGCPPGDAVGEGVQRHRPLDVLGGEQTVRYAGSRPDVRHQRRQLEALLLQRFTEQSLGRVVSRSFLHGVHSSHRLDSLHYVTQAEVNELILNHRPDICQPLALASTCRLLRTSTEPLLYRVADLCYGNLRAYTEHLRLLLHYPHLARHVRLLSFSNVEDGEFEKAHCEFLPPGPNRLPRAFAHLVAQDAPLSMEIFRQLGPETFGIQGFHPAMFHAMFLFLLPDVRSLKIDLSFPEKSWVEGDSPTEKARRELLWRALLQWPNSVWTASKVPALQNLEEFSLVFRGKLSSNTSDPRILLPFLFLPKIRILYTSSMVTFPTLLLKDRELSQWSGKSPVTEIIFDFAHVDGLSLDSILRLPTALEKLTINCNSWPISAGPQPIPSLGIWHDSDRALGHAFSHQRHSLRKIAVRWAEACAACSIRCLETFTALEELTCPLVMVLSRAEDGSRRSLAESLPASIVRLELLAYNHFPVPVWQLGVLNLLRDKEALAPRLRQLRIEHWMGRGDGPASKYEPEADAVVSLGRGVGVEVQVDFVENREPEAEGTTRQRQRVIGDEQ